MSKYDCDNCLDGVEEMDSNIPESSSEETDDSSSADDCVDGVTSNNITPDTTEEQELTENVDDVNVSYDDIYLQECNRMLGVPY